MLFRKLLRDMAKHKTQFISIFLMAFLAVFIYTGVGGEWRGLQYTVDDYYEKTNLADGLIIAKTITPEQQEKIAAIKAVTATERRTLVEAAVPRSSRETYQTSRALTLHFVEENKISKTYLVEGEDMDIADDTGIWPDKRFCDANELALGNEITLNIMGVETTKQIKGIIYAAEYVYAGAEGGLSPNFLEHGYAYLSHKAFPVQEHFAYTALMIKTDDQAGLEDKISAAMEGKYSAYIQQADYPSVALFQNEINQHKMMGDLFPAIFVLVALLTMMTTMTRIVSGQRTQIGTLKAMGFQKNAVMRHYISYGLWPVVVGAALGCVTGPLSLPKLFYPSMSSFYTIPQWKPTQHISFAVVTLLVILLCAFVTWLACANQLRDTPATTLRARAPKPPKHSRLEKTALWRRIGFNTQWNLRDATRNKTRSSMAIIGVLGCTALLVCAFSMNGSMKLLKTWQYETINLFETKISISQEATPEQVQDILAATDGEALMETAVEIRIGDLKRGAAVVVTDGVTLIQPTDKKRKPITLPADGVSITAKTAAVLGVKAGDTIHWHVYGSETRVETKIAVVYRDPTAQGLTMTRETFENLGYTFVPTAIVTTQKDIAHHEGISSTLSTSQIVDGWDELTEAMMLMVYVLIGGAAILSIVVLYNLGLLSFTEMAHDMATLKVMGMKTRKLRSLLLTQNLWFSVVGFVLGLPCGLWLVKAMTDASGDTFDFPVRLSLPTLAASFVITFGLSIFVSLLFSRKIKRLNMVEALKTTE